MKLNTVNSINGKIAWFDSPEPRYYRNINNQLHYSDNLSDWKLSTEQDTIAIHLLKDVLCIYNLYSLNEIKDQKYFNEMSKELFDISEQMNEFLVNTKYDKEWLKLNMIAFLEENDFNE